MKCGIIVNNKSAILFVEAFKTKICKNLIILLTHTQLVYMSDKLLQVSANHVTIFRDIKYKGLTR